MTSLMDIDKYRSLCDAIRQKNKAEVLNLLNNDPIVNLDDVGGNTPLHFAVMCLPDFEVIQKLLDCGAQLTRRNLFHKTPIHMVIDELNEDLLKFILRYYNGAAYASTVRPLSAEDGTMIINAAVIKSNERILDVVLEYLRQIPIMPEIVINAINTENLSIIERFLETGKNKDNCCRRHFLHYILFSYKGMYTEDILLLLNAKNFSYNLSTREDYDFVHKIVNYGRTTVLSEILNFSVHNTIIDENDNTFLHLACQTKESKIVKLLINNKVNINPMNKLKVTPLFYAVNHADMESIKLLLANGAEPNNYHLIAATNGKRDIVEILLDHGADVNAVDDEGMSALYHAIVQNNKTSKINIYSSKTVLSIVELLLKRGAKVDVVTKDGETPIFAAVRSNDHIVVELLIQYNAPVQNREGLKPLFLATRKQNTTIVEVLLKAGTNPDARDSHNKSPFDVAVSMKNKELIRVFLKYNSDISNSYGNGMNLFHVAAYEGLKNIVDNLLLNNFNINSQDSKGRTALHFAAKTSNSALVQCLLRNGADVNICTNKGATALDYVVKKMNKKRKSILDQMRLINRNRYYDDDDSFGSFDFDHDNFVELISSNQSLMMEQRSLLTALKQHIIKLNTIYRPVISKNLDVVFRIKCESSSDRELDDIDNDDYFPIILNDFESRCLQEARNLRMEKIANNVTLYDFLRRTPQLCLPFLENEGFINFLHSNELTIQFPIYADLINLQLSLITKRRQVMNDFFPTNESNKNTFFGMIPSDCVLEILNFLDDNDVRSLTEACKLTYSRTSEPDAKRRRYS